MVSFFDHCCGWEMGRYWTEDDHEKTLWQRIYRDEGIRRTAPTHRTRVMPTQYREWRKLSVVCRWHWLSFCESLRAVLRPWLGAGTLRQLHNLQAAEKAKLEQGDATEKEKLYARAYRHARH